MVIIAEVGEVSATRKNNSSISVEWNISNFSSLSDEDDAEYSSPPFSFDGHDWGLYILPNGARHINSYGFTQLMFGKRSQSPRTNTLYFSVALKHVNGQAERELKYAQCFGPTHLFGCLIQRSELLKRECELLPSGVLTVVCNMSSESSEINASETTECCHCRRSFTADSIDLHQRKCVHRPIICPDCLKLAPLMKCLYGEHECQNKKAEGVTATAECCHCKKGFSEDSINLHQEKCIHRPIICTDCLERVPLQKYLYGDHECKKENAQDLVSLGQDFKKVLLDGSNHDVILKVGDKELPAHRDVLKARSPVFYSMLNHDMVEKKSNIIPIPDCDPNAMQQFLLYVYSGKVETLDQDNMLGLYYVADKYQVNGLKTACSYFIKKSLSETNICDVSQLAVNHNDLSLLESAKEYFTNNMLSIIETVEWQKFMRENSTIANELLIKSVRKLNDEIKNLKSY